MTTPQAEAIYLARHLGEVAGRGTAIFNPHGKQIADLPVIYGFNNGGSPGWFSGVLLAEGVAKPVRRKKAKVKRGRKPQ